MAPHRACSPQLDARGFPSGSIEHASRGTRAYGSRRTSSTWCGCSSAWATRSQCCRSLRPYAHPAPSHPNPRRTCPEARCRFSAPGSRSGRRWFRPLGRVLMRACSGDHNADRYRARRALHLRQPLRGTEPSPLNPRTHWPRKPRVPQAPRKYVEIWEFKP